MVRHLRHLRKRRSATPDPVIWHIREILARTARPLPQLPFYGCWASRRCEDNRSCADSVGAGRFRQGTGTGRVEVDRQPIPQLAAIRAIVQSARSRSWAGGFGNSHIATMGPAAFRLKRWAVRRGSPAARFWPNPFMNATWASGPVRRQGSGRVRPGRRTVWARARFTRSRIAL